MQKNGGPAFPQVWHPDMGFNPRMTPMGMTLRDYAAIEFTKAWIEVMGSQYGKPDYETWDKINAYSFYHGRNQADAFIGWLAAREEEPTP